MPKERFEPITPRSSFGDKYFTAAPPDYDEKGVGETTARWEEEGAGRTETTRSHSARSQILIHFIFWTGF